MTLKTATLDLASNPRPQIAERIYRVAEDLFDAVKRAPLSARGTFPSIFHNNNFALAVHVTGRYAFLEITSKFRAQKSNQRDRLSAYRQLFCTKESGEPAIFALDKARLCRFSSLNTQGAHAFSLGSDLSLCVWDIRSSASINNRSSTSKVDVLYVVGFGEQIHEDTAWREFDALIRVTLADWSAFK